MAGRDVQRLSCGGLLLCSLLPFSLCPVRLGLAPVGGAERTRVSIYMKPHIFKMTKFVCGVRLCVMAQVL